MADILAQQIETMWKTYCETHDAARRHPPLLFIQVGKVFNVDLYECYAESEERENAVLATEAYILPDGSVLGRFVTRYDREGNGWSIAAYRSVEEYREHADRKLRQR